MNRFRWPFHPVAIFIYSLLAVGASLFLYIRWYLKVNDAFQQFLVKYRFEASKFEQSETWVIILTLSLLVAVIVLGLVMIFIYYQKMGGLYRQQQNFINGFTHELKTPIASINLYLDTFLKHDLPKEDQRKYLKFMQVDTQRLSDNVERILNLAKIEDKTYQYNAAIMDLREFLVKLVQKNAHMYTKGELRVIAEEGDNFKCSVAPSLFEIMVTNLIENGLNYNRSDCPRVEIRCERNKKEIKLRFIDNGIGISKKDQKRVFKKFFQVGRPNRGSGLGLFIVQQIVKIHKGTVEVESEGVGKGSEFIISFPIK